MIDVKSMWVVQVADEVGRLGYLANPLSPDVARFRGDVMSEVTPNLRDAELYWRRRIAELEAARVSETASACVVAVNVSIETIDG